LAATDGTLSDGVRLTWTAPAGDIADYEVSRSVDGSAPNIITNSGSPLTVTNFKDTTAVPNIVYTYTVKARTTAGATTTPPTLSAASASNDGWRGLGPPTAVVASDGDYINMVTVSFTGVPGISSYKVLRGLASQPDSAMTVLGTTAVSPYRDTTAVAGVLYKYGVKSTSIAGDTDMSATDDGYRSVGAPAVVTASNGTFTDRVEVSWSEVTGATGYRLFRAAAGATPGAPIATTTTTRAFVDTTGTAGVLYAYTVICDTAAGPGRVSNTAGGWRNVPPPTAVAASDGTFSDRVRITWTPDVSTPRYAVYRRIGLQGAIRVTTVTGSSYEDRTARAGQLYTYTVRSVVTPGESADSLPDTGWRFNNSGPNPDTSGGGSGSGMPALATGETGGFRGGSSSGLVAVGGGK
ncbi:MAG: hypothetical protein EBU70_13900, partial [Actinobacteria bacterium]|nr:hypothetical protein [Actinomycetota bacterium]